MKSDNFLLLCLMMWGLGSCNGKTAQLGSSALRSPDMAVAQGDTVSEIAPEIRSIFEDRNEHLWLGSNGQGVFRYDGKTLVRFMEEDGLWDNQVRGIQADAAGNLYFTTQTGVSKFDGRHLQRLIAVESVLADGGWKMEPGDLWFPGEKGPYRYDGKTLYALKFPKTKLEEEFYAQFPNSSFGPWEVYSVYTDRKGHVWFGTGSLGICRYDGRAFTWLTGEGLAESPVRAIYEDTKGYFWFGNSGQAVYRYDGKNVVNFRDKAGIGNVEGKRQDALVSYLSIKEDAEGGIWIATYEAGVWRHDPMGSTTHYAVQNEGAPVMICCMYQDPQGGLWLGSKESGAYRLNGKTFERVDL